MTHSPDELTFVRLAAQYRWVPVCCRLMSDALTPVSAFHRLDLHDSDVSACLFESVIGGEKVGRFSFLAVDPILELSATRKQVEIRSKEGVTRFECDDPLDELRRRLADTPVAPIEALRKQPFVGGAIGYAAYDVVRYTEHLPNAPEDDRGIPDLCFSFYDQLVVFDNVTKTMMLVVLVPAGEADEQAAKRSYREAQQKLDALVARLAEPRAGLQPHRIDPSGPVSLAYESNFTQEQFERAVERCVEYIRQGDIFQVVISQRLKVGVKADSFELYRTLRVINPSPFMFFLRTPYVTLVGSSPEIMCRVMDRRVTVRPLAGTRPRGADDAEDRRLAEELLQDPKEVAEHVMLVDLGRNDVGRVARYGSVQVGDVMTIERYSHVMHITSNVTGELADGKDAFDALRASVPAGTVSGAPKIRAMQIIDELESHRRGPYAGVVGYIDYNGNMDTCIALRTIVIKDEVAYVQAGAGIVADSVPEMEYEETLNKARGLLKAIQLTEQRAARPDSI